MAWSINQDNVENYAYVDKAFTPEECQKIIDLGNSKKKYIAQIHDENNNPLEDSNVRKNNVSWIETSEDSKWIYQKLTDICYIINQRHFNFDLWGFAEDLQFTEYNAPDEYYSAHIDKIVKSLIRKLSISRGMTTMFEDGFQKAVDGQTSLEEVLRVVRD